VVPNAVVEEKAQEKKEQVKKAQVKKAQVEKSLVESPQPHLLLKLRRGKVERNHQAVKMKQYYINYFIY
jgi:hypothetical protein